MSHEHPAAFPPPAPTQRAPSEIPVVADLLASVELALRSARAGDPGAARARGVAGGAGVTLNPQLRLHLRIPAAPERLRCLATCDGLQCSGELHHERRDRWHHASEGGEVRVWDGVGVPWRGGWVGRVGEEPSGVQERLWVGGGV